ncbi:MAG: hypothetical protein GTO24_12910 [candidate division Zixibacteria bacterium]|nr:hypothetical protein [candidate division Zixibacteria bacterium]
MKKDILFLILVLLGACLLATSSYAVKPRSTTYWEYLLEKPAWGMIEWNSATLPKGYWYPTFGFIYVFNGTHFDGAGREVDYVRGRDSTSYMLTGGLLYGVSDKLTVGLHIPVVLDQKVDTGGIYLEGKKGKSGVSNVGDIQFFFKYRMADRYFWSLAPELGITLPTGQPYNEVSANQSGTGDGQTDLDFALKGDILLNEEAFVKLGTRLTLQLRREYRNDVGELIEEKLGNVFQTDAGFVRNFKNFGLSGTLRYTFWGANKWNDEVMLEDADLFDFSLRFSVGEPKPTKHAKLDFGLDFPLTGKNAAATYRVGVSIKSIFK